MVESHDYIKVLAGLFAVLNPIGAVPIFISLTDSLSSSDRFKTVKITSLTVALILIIVNFSGESLLRFFGISLASFQVGGGILILLMAISMMHAKQPGSKQTKEEAVDDANRSSVAVVPLAIPLLAGPGTISSMILYSNQSPNLEHKAILSSFAVIVGLAIFIILALAPKITHILGKTGINIVMRVMGLIMAAMGIEFITQGLRVLLPGLA